MNLKAWNKDFFGHIFKRKYRILKRLEGINMVLMSSSNERPSNLRNDLCKNIICWFLMRNAIGSNKLGRIGCLWGIRTLGIFTNLA